jgi:hypothetical protein
VISTERVGIFILVFKAGKGLGSGMEKVDTSVTRGQPYAVPAVLQYIENIAITDAGGVFQIRPVFENPALPDIDIAGPVAFGSHPDISLTVFYNAVDKIVGNAVSGCFSPVIGNKPAFFPVKTAKPSAPGGDPEKSIFVFQYTLDIVVGDTVRIGGVVLIYSELITVIAVQSIHRAKPHKPLAVLQDTGYIALGEAITCTNMPELNLAVLSIGRVRLKEQEPQDASVQILSWIAQ